MTSPHQASAPVRCRICGNDTGNASHVVREAMSGSWEPFEYCSCADCGTLQIAHVPGDLGRYYGPGYYSLQAPADPPPQPWWLRSLKRRRTAAWLGSASPLGRVLAARSACAPPPWVGWLARAGATPGSAVLDVGSGEGHLLQNMRAHGMSNLLGVDPFLEGHRRYRSGVSVRSATVEEVDGTFDLIVANHSLEHVADPSAVLGRLSRLLAPSGTIVVRTPVMGQWAWRTYATEWVQIDAPRHLHVFTAGALERLAGEAGLTVDDVVFESDSFQFWGSELVRQGAAMSEGPARFGSEQMRRWDEQAALLDEEGDGDTGVFFLSRS